MITVAIPTIRAKTLRFTIESIRRQTYPDWELLLVAQGEDEELRRVGESYEKLDERIRFLHISTMGISFARNAAIDAARGEIIAFTDDDCEATPSWLELIVRSFEDDPELGLLGGALIAPGKDELLAVCPEMIPAEVTYDPTRQKTPTAGFDFIGGNFALRRAAARRVGPFDVHMGIGGVFRSAEDLDYKFRVEAAGVRMRSTPTVVVHHTYGRRRGWRAVFHHGKGYAVGQGALAAKLTMSGDDRGEKWLKRVRREVEEHARRGRVLQAASAMLRCHFVRQTYADCLRRYRLAAPWGLYEAAPEPRSASTPVAAQPDEDRSPR